LEQNFSTGGVAVLLNVTEPHISELVRRGKVAPAPKVVSGRRVWQIDHVLQAARALGRDPDEILRRIVSETSP